MIGIVKEVKFGYAFIYCQAGMIFCHAKQMPIDEVGRMGLMLGEEVEFEIVRGNKGKTQAANVRLLNPREPVDVATYFEEGTVHKTKPGFCHILRPYGGSAFLHWENVSSHGSADGRVRFWSGQTWRYQLAPPIHNDERNAAWRAMNAEEVSVV